MLKHQKILKNYGYIYKIVFYLYQVYYGQTLCSQNIVTTTDYLMPLRKLFIA